MVGRRKKLQIRRPKGKKKISAADDSSVSPPWIELPTDVTANILQRLGAIEIMESAQKVCSTWRRVCQEPAMWRVIDMENPGENHMLYRLNSMCRQAVERSEGQLIDINIEFFGTDGLLGFISSRSNDLRRLTIASSPDITGNGLREAVKSFPQLEELHLIFMPSIHAEDIENIAISCPMLKSFTFNDRGYRFPFVEINDGYAMAIANNMPSLRHLRLFGNRLSNEGLLAILDNCPTLESLDLRQCFNVDLREEIGKRCSQQIKNLRGVQDSTLDYEWDADIYDDEHDYSSGYSDFYEDYYLDYDDYTDPFNREYFPDDDAWIFGHDYF